MFDQALQFVPTFVLVFFRLAGMMLASPFFGSARVPRRVKLMCALVMALGAMPGIARPAQLPQTAWDLAAGIGGELIFGLAMGVILSMTFVAVQWAGEIIGQQMGLGIGAVFDPQFGGGGSVVGDLYFMLTIVIFLVIGGHRIFIRGVLGTFHTLPLLSVGMNQDLFDLSTDLLGGAVALALQLAAPMLVAMLLTDVVLGFVGKTIPQINVMTAGLSLRVMLGMVVLIVGLAMTSEVISQSMGNALREIERMWVG
jgi:flagellar biosynthetic protein FliR